MNNSTQKQKLKKHKSDKPHKTKKNKTQEDKNKIILTTPKAIPSLNLMFLPVNTNSTPSITPPPTPTSFDTLNLSYSTDSSLSGFESISRLEGPKSLGMLKTKPLSNFEQPQTNQEKPDEKYKTTTTSFKK